jgi:hypothetical protein
MNKVIRTMMTLAFFTLVYAFVSFTPAQASEDHRKNNEKLFSHHQDSKKENHHSPFKWGWDHHKVCNEFSWLKKGDNWSKAFWSWHDWKDWKNHHEDDCDRKDHKFARHDDDRDGKDHRKFAHHEDKDKQDRKDDRKFDNKDHRDKNDGGRFDKDHKDGRGNDFSFRSSNRLNINQSNNARITNNVFANSNTGNNSISRNSWGDSSIRTGDAHTSVSISNNVNSNVVRF